MVDSELAVGLSLARTSGDARQATTSLKTATNVPAPLHYSTSTRLPVDSLTTQWHYTRLSSLTDDLCSPAHDADYCCYPR